MKPTSRQIEWALQQFGMLKFFPTDPGAKEAVAGLLERMVSTADGLEWLVSAMVDQVGEWRGPKELRGVYCARFAPADGIEAWCEHGPYTADAMEQRSLEADSHVKKLPAADLGWLLPAGSNKLP